MRTVKFCIYLLILCIFLTACGKAVSYEAAAEETAAEKVSLNYGQIESDFSGLTPGVAAVFLGIVDDLSSHLGYDEAEASGGEYLQGGFVRDWNGDGMPELCLLLKTSPGRTAVGTELPSTAGIPRRFISTRFKTGKLCSPVTATSILQPPAEKQRLPPFRQATVCNSFVGIAAISWMKRIWTALS